MPTYETRTVIRGEQAIRRPVPFESHTVEVDDDGGLVRALCPVSTRSIAPREAVRNVAARPTCAACARQDPRWRRDAPGADTSCPPSVLKR